MMHTFSMRDAPAGGDITRVLMVDHAAEPGGGQLGLLRYLENLTDPGIEAVVLFYTGGPIVERISELGYSVHVVDKAGTFSFLRAGLMSRRVGKLIRKLDPDVVVANSLYATIGIALSRMPRRARLLYYSRLSMTSLTGLKRVLALRVFFAKFHGFIANSRWTASGIPSSLSRPVRVAYPVCGVTPDAIANVTRAATGEFAIVSLSRPDRWKGTDLLIQAMSHLPAELAERATLRLYGGAFYSDPEFVRECHTLAKQSPVPVSFEGHVEDVAEVLRAADVLVLGSRMPEPFGQVVPQAMAYGSIAVVPDEGGPMEVLEDDLSGLVFRSGDPKDLAESIARASLPETATRIRNAARVAVEQFADVNTTSALTAVIRELVELTGQQRSRD